VAPQNHNTKTRTPPQPHLDPHPLQVHHYVLSSFAGRDFLTVEGEKLVIGFDDMCHLARFAAAPARLEASEHNQAFVDNTIKVGDFLGGPAGDELCSACFKAAQQPASFPPRCNHAAAARWCNPPNFKADN
jgi:hypothetical protein